MSGGFDVRGGEQRAARPVVIVVPQLKRDLEGHALLAYHLQHRFGHPVRLCGLHDMEQVVDACAPSALVIDYLSTAARARVAAKARRRGARVVIVPTTGFYQDDAEELRGLDTRPEAIRLVDCYLAWGDRVRDLLIERTTLPASRAHAVGCLRFDQYAEPYLALAPTRAEFMRRQRIRNPDAPLIVWPTNTYFTSAKYPITDLKAQRSLEDSRTSYEEISRLVLELSRRHPEWNFAIRLHPSEQRPPYRALARQASNIYLSLPDVPIRDVLLHTSILLQRWSTTATEAWMLGRPVIEYARGHYHTTARPDYLEGADVVTDVDEAEARIAAYLAGQSIPETQQAARQAFIARTYFTIDGRTSARCAQIIDELVRSGDAPELDGEEAGAESAEAAWNGDGAAASNGSRDGAWRAWKKWAWRQWRRVTARDDPFAWDDSRVSATIDGLYRSYDRLLSRASGRASGGDSPLVASGPRAAESSRR